MKILNTLSILMHSIFCFSQGLVTEINESGIIFPQVNSIDRDLLSADVGQCIYNLDTGNINCFDGQNWRDTYFLISDLDNDTYVNVEQTLDVDEIVFGIKGIEKLKLVDSRIEFKNTNGSIFIGEQSAINLGANQYDNIGVGKEALKEINNGQGNIALGRQALMMGDTIFNNIAIGFGALKNHVSGPNNIALGNSSLLNNQSGVGNISLNGLSFNLTGNRNIGVGTNSLTANESGNDNIGIGQGALFSNISGHDNIGIGRNTDNGGSSFSNTVSIGYNARCTSNNQIRFGNSQMTSIGGFVDWSNVSDLRLKINIEENVPGLNFINKLRPISYNLNQKKISKISNMNYEEVSLDLKQSGFIAQEVASAAKELNFDFSGIDYPKNDKDYFSLRYATFTVPLVKAVQELSEQNKNLKDRLDRLEKIILKIENRK